MELYRDLEIAFQPSETILERQRLLLRSHIRYCREASPYYRNLLGAMDVDADAPLQEILAALPLTRKQDLAEYNPEFYAVPRRKVVDLVMSSGTTGKPTYIPYTDHDLQRLAYNEEKAFAGCGLGCDDTVLLTCSLDRCFVAGLAYFLGARNLGATAIRNGHDTLDGHAAILRRATPTAMVGVPSFLRKLGGYLADHGMDPAGTSVRRIVAIGEPVRGRNMELLKSGRDIESLWGASVYSTYASSETVTSFCECTAQCGGHLHPDLAVVEVVDVDGQPVSAGEIGEVVVTPLAVEGMPLLRFCTGDLSFLVTDPCACGRNALRLGPVLGRRAQMLKVRGTTLYPPAIQGALDELEEVSDYYIVAESDAALSDTVTAHVSLRPGSVITARDIAVHLRSRLRVTPGVCIEPEASLRNIVYTPASRKPVRFIDRRRDAVPGDGSA